ncbi:GNAT family N-acetyltransferase [Nocardioides aequoreus]|uniref:GNAT family N-acetyltransferase n=1 Tax=Nocardioides aequoreus TaxID=397278 RepID=UPI00069171BC|nr:GNAT family N-acetyltransferase [Nocardioides aequoreus]
MRPVVLVPLTAAHVPALLDAMQDAQVRRFTRVPVPMPDGWIDTWVAGFDGERRHGWAVLDPDDGRFLGYAVTGPVDRTAREVELGYAVVPGARGQGVATATLHALSRWALDEGMLRLTALVSTGNPASSRVCARVGYTLEGVLRSVHHRGEERQDLECWSLLPGELAGDVAGEPADAPPGPSPAAN